MPVDSMWEKSTDFQSPNISFLNIPNYQKHFSQKCYFSPIAINTESQYTASLGFQMQESCRKEGMTRGYQLGSVWVCAPLYTPLINTIVRKHNWSLPFLNLVSKQREPLCLFKSKLFKVYINKGVLSTVMRKRQRMLFFMQKLSYKCLYIASIHHVLKSTLCTSHIPTKFNTQ